MNDEEKATIIIIFGLFTGLALMVLSTEYGEAWAFIGFLIAVFGFLPYAIVKDAQADPARCEE